MATGLRGGEYEARSHLASFQPPDDGRGTRAAIARTAAFAEPVDHHQFALLSLSADILATLATAEVIGPACEAICLRLRTFFSAEHVALGLVNLEQRSRELLGFTSAVVDVAEISTRLAESDIVAYRDAIEGRWQAFPDLGTAILNPGTEVARQAGLRSLIRAPFRLSDGSVGLVSVASATRGHLGDQQAADLQALCTPIGLAVDRVRLLAAANERQANATALATMLSTLNAGASPEEAAQRFAEDLRETIGADVVTIYSFDLEAGVRTRVALVAPFEAPSLTRVHLRDSPSFQAMLQSRAVAFAASDQLNAASPVWLSQAVSQFGGDGAFAVRLDGSSGPVGMLVVGYRRERRLNADVPQLLDAIAPVLALVIGRALTVASLQEQTRQTQVVMDVLTTLSTKESAADVGQPVAAAIRAMYQADHCAIGIVDGDQVSVAGLDTVYPIAWPLGSKVAFGPLDESTAIGGGVIHVISDLRESDSSASYTSQLLRDEGMRSSMRVLIGPPSAPFGVVTVGASAVGYFSHADARRLAAAVEPVALAIARVRDLRTAQLRAANLETINHVLTLLGEGGNPDHMAAGFLRECRALFECQLATVVTFDDESGMAHRLGLDSSIFGTDVLPKSLPMGTDSTVERTNAPELIEDLEAEPNPGTVRKLLVANGLRSAIRVPLIVHDAVIGAVSLWSTDLGRFDADDVAILGTLSRPLALALGRVNALNSLAESELKFRSLIAQAEEMIFLFDSTTLRIVDANAYTERALGYSRTELLALHVDQLVNAEREDVLRNVRTTVQQGELHLVERVYKRKDGTLLDVDVVASPVIYGGRDTVLALVRDVSERRSFQAQLVQGQKMESLGLMAGNLAHDFNNLLTTILGFSGLLKRSTNLDGEERENLGLIETAARSAADLTGRLLSFARGGLVKFGPVDLRLVVEDTLRIAGPSLHGALTVTTTFGPNSAAIEGDGGQVQQALLNIVLNAKDAMPEGGSIAISLMADDTTAQLTIADNGPGMTEETRRRIFEPFYTTKPLGSGTGLGMAITYGIIQGHHGDISVESRLGKGTTFTITLPLFDPGTAQPGGNYDPGEGNLILVVDDDEMVRRTTSATLAALGYNVVEAPGGATAVQVVKARPDRIAAVLLDLVMPGMTGSETFRALTELRPDLPVIVCTGYAADAHIDNDVQRRIAGLVQKPFTAERLDRALSDAGVTPTRR
ncbi:MAG: ATP-binding protein [Anaerolineaceae bacterium]